MNDSDDYDNIYLIIETTIKIELIMKYDQINL